MTRIRTFFERFPLFLFLIPVFVIVHIEREYHGLINYAFVYRQVIELLIAPVVIWLLSFILFRDLRKSLAFCLAFMLVFYFFADLKDGLTELWKNSFFSSYKFLLPFTGLALLVTYVTIRKSASQFRSMFLFANVLFLCFIVADLVLIVLYSQKQQRPALMHEIGKSNCNDCVKPDIYYVVFDSYTSSTRLKNEFGYDNSRMDSFLSHKGFYQVKQSRSNYNFTPYSIGSTLNYDYFHGIPAEKKVYLRDYLPYIGLIRDNNLVRLLESKGYQIVNHSIFDFRKHPSTIPPYDLWSINILYKRHNIFKKIDMEIGWIMRSRLGPPASGDDMLSNDYIRSRDKHDSLAIAALNATLEEKNITPRFVYTHIEIPHAPFSFDSLGTRHAVPVSLSPEEDKHSYIQQLVYSNKQVIKVIDAIFAKSTRPFIIVLQGDHGFKYFNPTKRAYEFDNLNAFYFYNKDYRLLHDSLTSVNTFRVVLNTFFGTDLSLRKDTTVFLPYQ